jgi:hypothetical protein
MKKTLAAILLIALTVGALGVAATANAKPFMNWRTFPNMQGNGFGHRQFLQQSYVRWNGIITDWGTANVTGAIQAQSRTMIVNQTNIRQGASATAMWTTNTSRPISALRAKENFTYTFNTARLTNANVSGLNIGSNDFFLNGTWTVYQVETTFTINTDVNGTVTGFHRSQDATVLVTNAYGELTVTGNWANFTLDINGIDPLTGTVHRQITKSMHFNPFKVNDDDDSANPTALTSADVSTIVHAYGAMPGYGNYDQRMDYNFNYKIDIADLATAAANLNAQ